jgi:hypothetical protein
MGRTIPIPLPTRMVMSLPYLDDMFILVQFSVPGQGIFLRHETH